MTSLFDLKESAVAAADSYKVSYMLGILIYSFFRFKL
jgi:hypothetical protein